LLTIRSDMYQISSIRRFRFHRFDTGTGLNYMDARYEGPTLSRFLSQDPNFIQGGPENWQNSDSANPEGQITIRSTSSSVMMSAVRS
jgi:RHS repeat-associated protein